MTVEAVGLAAGALTTAAWLPQIVCTVRRGSADDLSWAYLLVFGAGVAGWITYALLAGDGPVLGANLVTLSLVALLGWVKARGTGSS
ncbi:MAG: hypothetical protein KDB10_21960 [Acidimicrobiales bacterium]|nr:hypothetical protein [Acidimicrobiales bacterium]MCB9372107.1 hypothetical protein [Microthrixaceae bacterium]